MSSADDARWRQSRREVDSVAPTYCCWKTIGTKAKNRSTGEKTHDVLWWHHQLNVTVSRCQTDSVKNDRTHTGGFAGKNNTHSIPLKGAFPGFLQGGLRRDPGGFPGHHGWPAPPAANFFRARSLATIDTLPNWPKIRPFPPPQNGRFSARFFSFSPR